MINRLKSLVMVAAASFMLALPFVLATSVPASAADISKNLCNGANLNTNSGSCTDSNSSFQSALTSIVNVFSLVIGIVAVFMIIIGGFNYITSGGNESKVSGAKNTILYAIVGLVIVLFAQVIVRFVIRHFKSS